VSSDRDDRELRVLIADDHAPTRDDVRRALAADAGFTVCAEAGDAAEAVQAAVRECPDVCLLDICMPGSGIAAAWEISARLPETKIVMLTVSDDDRNLFAALRAGASGYLVKTMDLERLPLALRGVVRGEAPIQRALVTRLLERFRDSDPRRRLPIAGWEEAERLTSREWEILVLMAQDCSTAQIAQRLSISKSATRVHIAGIVRKLAVENRAAAVELFRRRSAT
jgi:two-component system, NarL family, nitrate/nitrite response regulator NarL